MTNQNVDRPIRFGFLILPRFTALHLELAADSLRIANRVAEAHVFEWQMLGHGGGALVASNGRAYEVEDAFARQDNFDVAIIIAGYEPEKAILAPHLAWARHQDRHAKIIAAFDTGTVLLAAAGLARGRQLAIHWEHRDLLLAEHADLDLSSTGIVEDGRYITASGGLSVAAAMLAILRRFRPAHEIGRLADILYCSGREPESGAAQTQNVSRRAEQLMRANLQAPLTLDELASGVGLHKRTFLRAFEAATGTTPMRRYREIRLAHARELLAYSGLAIKEIAALTGFSGATGFSTAFRNQYGQPPSRSR